MSMGSKLKRNEKGELELNGKPYVIALDTGDDTPVKVDERFDVDLNKLVSNEMARQDLFKIPGHQDYQDLGDYPRSRGEAQHRLITVEKKLADFMKPGETLEDGNRRYHQHLAAEAEKTRKYNAEQQALAEKEKMAVKNPPESPSGQETKTP